MIVVALLGGVLLVALLLMVVSAVLPDFKIEGIGAAFTAAVIASAVGFALQFVVNPFLLPHLPKDGWILSVVSHAVSSVTLAIGIAFAPGIQAGLLSTLAAAVIVTVAESAVMAAVVPLVVTWGAR